MALSTSKQKIQMSLALYAMKAPKPEMGRTPTLFAMNPGPLEPQIPLLPQILLRH